MSKILYGKPVAENLDIQSKDIFKDYESKHDKLPRLTAITVGDNPASLMYVSVKEKKAQELGVEFNWISELSWVRGWGGTLNLPESG